jgi:hypothetical protein
VSTLAGENVFVDGCEAPSSIGLERSGARAPCQGEDGTRDTPIAGDRGVLVTIVRADALHTTRRASLSGTVDGPSNSIGGLLSNTLATFAEFEVELLRLMTLEAWRSARAIGKPESKPPKLGLQLTCSAHRTYRRAVRMSLMGRPSPSVATPT